MSNTVTRVFLSHSLRPHVSASASLRLRKSTFPQPPKNFVASLDVETIYLRYKAYRQNREPFLSMAYMCLSVIEASVGGRRKDAAKKYSIDHAVLDKLGELASERGDKLEARKVPKKGALTPLAPNERRWIDEVIKRIILRVGEYAFNPKARSQKITMNDLSKLP